MGPYLATRVLNQMAQDYLTEFPEASQSIRTGFYMDGLLQKRSGANGRHLSQTALIKSWRSFLHLSGGMCPPLITLQTVSRGVCLWYCTEVCTGEEKLPIIQSHVVQKSGDSSELFSRLSCQWKLPKGNNLTVQELESATNQLIKVVQKECFPEELSSLLSKKELKSGSKLAKLVSFLDADGLIRVKGRIQNSELGLGYDSRHPMMH